MMDNQSLERLYYNRINSPLKNKLDSCLGIAFAVDKKMLAQMSLADKNVRAFFDKKYLPYHTHDNKWLARYLRQVYLDWKKKENTERIANNEKILPAEDIELADIEEYVTNSYRFFLMRDQYEQAVTRLVAENKARITKEDNPVVFRDGILKMLTQFGFEKKNIAYALEQSANLWREKVIDNAFVNYITSNKFPEVTRMPVVALNDEERQYLQNNFKFETKDLFRAENNARMEFKKFVENRYYACSKSARKYANRNALCQQYAEIGQNPKLKKCKLIEDAEVHLNVEYIRGWETVVRKLCEKYVGELSGWCTVVERYRKSKNVSNELNEELLELPTVDDGLTQ